MATKKAEGTPHFPHPPLEVGVAQYPTPLVPNYNDKKGGWGINDLGHIILVEKASIEKGSFTPQPLDGSVIYTGRDANRWPSSLYLVAERPTPEGEFIYRYWANDRTLSSQNLWNYGLDYSSNNPDYPVTSRTYIVPRSQYSTEALGSVDPVFGGTQVISQQKMIELPEDNPLYSRYVAVQRVYESIPGPILSGKQLDSRGDLETITVQTVVAGTEPTADGLLVTGTSVEPVDSVKSTKKLNTVASYATLTTKSKKSGLLGTTSTTDDIVAPSTSPDALSLTVLESSVEALTVTKSRKKTTSSSGPTELDGKTIGEFGFVTTAESIVAYDSSLPTPTKNTVKLDKSPLDLAKSKLTNSSYDDLSQLTGYQYDENLNLFITNTKELINAGTESPTYSNGLISSRDEPVDKWKTIRIQSKISELPASRTEYKTASYASPNLLYGFNVPPPFQFPDGQLQYNITPVMRAERSYQTVQKFETTYAYGNPDPPTDTLFDPLSVHVVYNGFFARFDIPNCLTDSVDNSFYIHFNTGINTPAAAYYGPIDEFYYVPSTTNNGHPFTATDYTNLVGTYEKVSYELEYWKANIWRKVITSVLIK